MIFTYEVEAVGNIQLQHGNVVTTIVEAENMIHAIEGSALWIKNLATTLDGTAARLLPYASLDGAYYKVTIRYADHASIVKEADGFKIKHNHKGGFHCATVCVDLNTFQIDLPRVGGR